MSIIFRDKISHVYHKLLACEIIRPLQQRIVFCNFLFILSSLLTQRVSTLQEMHRYFVLNEYVSATQRNKRHLLLLFSRMVQQRGFRQREATGLGLGLVDKIGTWFKVLLANRDMDPLWKMPAVHFEFFISAGKLFCPFIRIVTMLHAAFVWLPFPRFPIGQVRFQVWCRPYLAAYFGFFELRKFPWSLS